VCAENCPKEAIKWDSPVVVAGRLVRKPKIDFDVDACILCGECATVCPIDALRMEIDGEEIATIVKNEAFPVLYKEINVASEKCQPECRFVCQEVCPTEAINVSIEGLGGKATLTNLQLDESLCIYCRRCEAACPFDVIEVRKPFLGTIRIDTEICPDDCRACVDICPAHAVQIDENGKPKVPREFCVYCFACQKVCPEGAIEVKRQWIFHSDVRSACWLTALRKLTSDETVSKELASDSGKRRQSRVHTRNVGATEKW